jgi:hypothetical protein
VVRALPPGVTLGDAVPVALDHVRPIVPAVVAPDTTGSEPSPATVPPVSRSASVESRGPVSAPEVPTAGSSRLPASRREWYIDVPPRSSVVGSAAASVARPSGSRPSTARASGRPVTAAKRRPDGWVPVGLRSDVLYLL